MVSQSLIESIVDYVPEPGSKNNFRLQCSISLEEANELNQLLMNPALPFEGDMTRLIRTAVRWFLMKAHEELEESDGSFLQGMQAVKGSVLMKWSREVCDSVAREATDNLKLAVSTGALDTAGMVFDDVVNLLGTVKHPPARLLLKHTFVQRGFISAVSAYREALLAEGHDVYDLDNSLAEAFA